MSLLNLFSFNSSMAKKAIPAVDRILINHYQSLKSHKTATNKSRERVRDAHGLYPIRAAWTVAYWAGCEFKRLSDWGFVADRSSDL